MLRFGVTLILVRSVIRISKSITKTNNTNDNSHIYHEQEEHKESSIQRQIAIKSSQLNNNMIAILALQSTVGLFITNAVHTLTNDDLYQNHP